MRSPFNLRLWFGASSLGLIAVMCVVATYFLSEFITNALLERESEVSQEFLESVILTEGDRAFQSPVGGEMNDALRSFTHHIVSLPGMFRANVHTVDHFVLWSTEARLIGQHFDVNPELERALKGERVTEVGSASEIGKLEHVALQVDQSGHFIEAYVPVRSADGSGRILGVVEFYKAPTALNQTIAEGTRLIWLSSVTASFLLFACLYWIVQRGANLIERQQKELSRLEALGAIGQMAGAVAHSLRNPMANIRTTAELLADDATDSVREIATEVIHEVDRMDQYVRDLLTYVRVDAYELRPVDPAQIIRNSIGRFRPALQRQGIEVVIDDRRRRQGMVIADANLLEQALASVFSNAVEAMPGGGRLVVALDEEQQGLRLSIADTGTGIPADVLKNVSNEYFTTKTHGLGLGLALARGIIDRFAGKLQIESESGKGTTVNIVLRTP